MNIKVVGKILEANDRIAEENRALFKNIYVVNLMSAPGAGKTSLLEATIRALGSKIRFGIIEGDIETDRDARRVASLGVPVVQINTNGACHLDANMIRQAVSELPLSEIDILIIENVGNLVCPAEFDVGEDDKVMVLSIAEGDDKPLKYPLMFKKSSALLINKIDLLPYLDSDPEKIKEEALRINPDIEIFTISCRTGQGLGEWFNWLTSKIR